MIRKFLFLFVSFTYCALQSFASPTYEQITGDWKSNYGPVHLDFVRGEKPAGSAMLKGYWLEPPGNRRGVIEECHYNSRTGDLAVQYLETWSKVKGKITLKLDASGRTFAGSFKSSDGSTGSWNWKR
jgi:hypothetical protein